MNATTKQTNESTLFEKAKIIQSLAIFPALTIQVFLHRRVGFRALKPARLVTMAAILMVINALTNSLPLVKPAGFLFGEFPLALLAAGFIQRHRRWKELCSGERWHTQSAGVSYLEGLPLPMFLRVHRRLYRFVEPAACFIFAIWFVSWFSHALSLWIAFASFALFVAEQTMFEAQLDRDLDLLDGLVVAEIQNETVAHFQGPQPEEEQRTLDDTAGVPTGVSLDISKQIELRRKQAASAGRFSSEERPVNQYVQVNVLAARDNPAPQPPDNLVKDAPDASQKGGAYDMP